MLKELHTLQEGYFAWLKDKTTLKELDGWVEITTPFLDRHRDYLQLYVGLCESGYKLTDGGYVIVDLEQSGCELNTPKRQSMLAKTLRSFGVQRDAQTNELYVHASEANYPQRKHSLVQAMLAINDMFYMASPFVASFFLEDAAAWLETAGIRYIPSVKLTGVSGLNHHFDFVIPKSIEHPERVLLGLNRPDRANVERTVFAWEDTRKVRDQNARAYVLLNDIAQKIADNTLGALRAYQVQPILWSERDSVRAELAA